MSFRAAESNIVAVVLIGAAAVLSALAGPIVAGIAALTLLGLGSLVIVARGLSYRIDAPSVTTVVQTHESESEAPPPDLKILVIGAIVVRLAVAVLVNATDLYLSFAPDANSYEKAGEAIVRSWNNPGVDLVLWMTSQGMPLYHNLNAYAHYAFGESRFTLSFVNCFVGAWASWNVARLAHLLYGPQTSRAAFLLMGFFPSMVLWTSMNIRESWSLLALSLVLLCGQKLRNGFSLPSVLTILASTFGMLYIRAYLVPFILIGLAISYLAIKPKQLPYAILGLGAFGVVIRSLGENPWLSTDLFSNRSLEQIHYLRTALAHGGSAYGADADTRTLSGALLYLPEGLMRFLMSPFPWNIRSWLQALTLPETLAWYVIFMRSCRGMWTQLSRRFTETALPFFVMTSLTVAYALVSGNEGTAYRHRAQVLMVFFVFAAADGFLRPKTSGVPTRSSLRSTEPLQTAGASNT